MNLILDLVKEAFVVGILLVLIVHLVINILSMYDPSFLVSNKKNYNLEIVVFTSGFLFHILCELLGINIWYLNNSVAYKRTQS